MRLPVLRSGSSGQEVRYLQDLLGRNGFTLNVDGQFGPNTNKKVLSFQRAAGLVVDGIVGPRTWGALKAVAPSKGRSYALPLMEERFIPLGNPKRRPGTRHANYNFKAKWVTIHNTANPTSTAENERNWLINPKNTRTASWHYAVDDTRSIQAIPENEVAWHAGNFEGNNSSIGIEVCESGNQIKTWENAVALAAYVLSSHGWGVERLTTHSRWSGKGCPRLISPNWNLFVADVHATIASLKGKPKVEQVIEPIPTPILTPIPTPIPLPTPITIPNLKPIPKSPCTEEPILVPQAKEESVNVGLINKILEGLLKLINRFLGGK